MLPEELLFHTSNGDKTAFRQLYDLFKDRVYNTCVSYLQQVNDAEEVTQDVFVEVYNAAGSYKGNASVSTWIYRIAINKCLDKMRYNNRQKRFTFLVSLFKHDTGELHHDPPDFVHPGVSLEQKEKSRILFNAMQQLPENQKTAFVLKQIEGLSQKEIAAIMDLGEKAVESLMQRAKSNLRNILSDFYDKNEGFKHI